MTVLSPPHKTTLAHVESHFIIYHRTIINFIYPPQDAMRDVNLVEGSSCGDVRVRECEYVRSNLLKAPWKWHYFRQDVSYLP